MRLRADWMGCVLTVPYVPVLGPVHPDQFTPETFVALFAEVLAAGRTGCALPFDKDRRWSPRKAVTVLVDEIAHRPEHTIIPVLSPRGGGTITTFYYGPAPDLDTLRASTRRCRTTYHAVQGRVVWFSACPAAGANCRLVLLKEFGRPRCTAASITPAVSDLDHCAADVLATFPAFAGSMAEHGFDFLCKRRDTGLVDGPILVIHCGRRVVGAIGPMTILHDRRGRRMLLPQYFGVLPERRGCGHGRALWRAAENWGLRHGADYQLLQARAGSASERLFLSEGLRPLGYAAAVSA